MPLVKIPFHGPHFLKLSKSLSANSLLRQESASPRWRMKPARAMMSFFPVILPFSSTYQSPTHGKHSGLSTTRTNHRSGADSPQRAFAGPAAGSGSGVCTYLSDFDLNGGVVLGSDESVGGRALAGDVDVHNVSFVVLHLY